MEQIQLKNLIRHETKKLIVEALTAAEKQKLREFGVKLSDWAEKNYQKDLRQAKNDRELRDLAEKDLSDYHKIADALKNGNAERAADLTNRMDTAAHEAIPDAIYNAIMQVHDREATKLDLEGALKMFEMSFASVRKAVAAGNWETALEMWEDLIKLEAEDVTDLLKDLEKIAL